MIPIETIEAEIVRRRDELNRLEDLRAVTIATSAIKRQVAPCADVIGRLVRSASKQFGVVESDIQSKLRTRDVADARKAVMYLLRTETEATVEHIGRLFGCHHSNVSCAVKSASEWIQTDRAFAAKVESIKKETK